MKKYLSALLALMLAAFMVFGLVACKDDGEESSEASGEFDDILESYLLEIDGTTVNKDFVLPAEIAGHEVSWESSSEYVKIEKREGDYLAAVTLPDEITEVTLTVKMGNSTKTFTIRVAAFDVYVFLDNYAFPKDKQTVVEDFALDTEYTYKDKTATISWSVDDEFKDYLEISSDGKTCIIHGSSLDPTVKIKATFSYNGDTASKTYRMIVSLPMSDLEKADYWYNNTGITRTISGYVVAKGPWTNYNGTYEAILYVIDDSLLCGYYIYNEPTDMDEETYKNLKVGTHITCTNPVNADYNGLMETSNYKGKTTIDADIEPIDITPYALDNDLIGNVPALRYRQSTLVSLTNWKIKSIDNSKKLADKSPTTLITLTKGGVDIAVQVTKYFYDYSHDNADPVIQEILAKVSSLKVGDWVTVTGVLGWYKAPQIALLSADGITAGEKDNTKEFPGAKVKALIEANEKVLAENNIDKIVVSEKNFNLATKSGDVTAKFELCSDSNAITISDGNFKIIPAKQEKIHVQATYTCGDYSTTTFFYIESALKDDADMAKEEAEAYFLDDQNAGTVALRTEPLTYDKVKLTFSVVDEASKKLVSISGGNMVLSPVEQATKVSIRVTATCGDQQAFKDVPFTILVSEFMSAELVKNPAENTEYKIGIDNGKNVFLATGKMSGFYGVTSTDANEAVPAFVEKTDGGYRLYVMIGNAKKYVNMTVSGEHYNYTYDDTPSTVWSYNGYYFSTKSDGKKVWAGSRGTYTTLGCYLGESYDPAADNSYPLALYNVVKDTATPAQRAAKELSLITIDPIVTENYQLPTDYQKYYDVSISWSMKGSVEGQRVSGNVLHITRGEEDVEVTLVATARCGEAKKSKEFKVTVAAISKLMSVGQIYELGAELSSGSITGIGYECIGIVKKIAAEYDDNYQNVSFWMMDESGKEVEAYRVKGDAASKVKAGDVVTVSGKVQNYNGTIEFVAGSLIKARVSATFKTVSELYTDGKSGSQDTNTVFSTYGTVTKVINGLTDGYDTINVMISDGKSEIECYKLAGDKDVLKNVKVGDKLSCYGKMTVYGETVEFNGCKLITVTGEVIRSDEENAKLAAKAYKLPELHAGANELPTENSKYPGVTYSFEITDASSAKYLTVDGNKLVASTVEKETPVKVKVTAKCGEATSSVDLDTKILVTEFITFEKVESPEANKEYKLGFDNGKIFLATGAMSGYYGVTSNDEAEAVPAFVETVSGGYRLYVKVGNAKKYVNMTVSGEHYNFTYDDKATTVWTYENGYFATMSDAEKIWIGSRGTYTTLGAYKDSQYSMTASSSYPLSLYTVVVDDSTPAERAKKELELITLPKSVTDDYSLPATYQNYYDVILNWALKTAVEGQSVEDNVLKVTRGEDDIKVTLVCEAVCGEAKETKEFEITVLPRSLTEHEGTASDPYTVADAIKVTSKLGDKEYSASKVYIKGIIKSCDDKGTYVQNIYLVNAEGDEESFLVYSANETETVKDPKVGDTVTIYGWLVNWGGLLEMSNNTIDGVKDYPTLVALGSDTPVDPTKPTHKGTADDPYSAADAIKVASALEAGAYTDEQVYVKGIITSCDDKGAYVMNIKLADKEGDATTFLVYTANETDAVTDPVAGDTVTVYGYLVNYSGTPEMSSKTVDGSKVYPTLTAITKGTGKDEPVDPVPTGDPVHKGTKDDPYTASDANIVGGKLENNAFTDTAVYVKGIVSSFEDAGNYVKNLKLVDKSGDTADFLCYTVNKTDAVSEIKVGDTVVVCGYIKNYSGTAEIATKKVDTTSIFAEFISSDNAGDDPVVPPVTEEPEHAGTKADPYTVADAIIVAGKLEAGKYSETQVYIKGIILSCDDKGAYVLNTKLVDKEGDTTSFLCYTANESDAVVDPKAGDTVVIYGYLTNYSGTLEMSNQTVDGVKIYPTFISIERGKDDDEGGEGDDVITTLTGNGTLEKPYTAADAISVCKGLARGAYTDKQVYVKGIITELTDKGTYVQNVKLADKEGDETTFLVYTANETETCKDPSVGDVITLYGYLVNWSGTPEMSSKTVNDEKVYPTIIAIQRPSTVGDGTLANPYTAADAISVCKDLAESAYSDKQVYVKGIITECNDKGSYVQNIKLADNEGDTTTFLVYSANETEECKNPVVGDTVVIYGYLVNYYGTPEMSSQVVDDEKIYPTIISITKPSVAGDGSLENPYSPAEATALCLELEKGAYSETQVYVKGIIKTCSDAGSYVQNINLVTETDDTAFLVYSANETDDWKDPAVGDTVIIYGYLVNWGGTPEMSSQTVDGKKIYPTFAFIEKGETEQVVLTGDPKAAGTASDPYSAKDAILAAKKLETGAFTDNKYYVKGIVQSCTDKGSFIQNIYLYDEGDTANTFLVYSANETADVKDVKAGDTVTICGYITNYNGLLEMSGKKIDGVTVYPEFVAKN